MRYFDLIVESEDAKDNLARFLSCVHGFNASRKSERLAWSLPDFLEARVEESGRVLSYPQPGSRLRVFGSEAALREFLASGGVSRLLRLGVANALPIEDIPLDAKTERFTRDRKLQKTYRDNAYARRQKARAKEQGRAYCARKMSVEPSVRFETRSSSNQHQFLLDVRRELCDSPEPWFVEINAYGLSTPNSATPKF